MLAVSAIIGLNRVGGWLREKAFTPRGRYESTDIMGGAGRMADWAEVSCLLHDRDTLSKADITDALNDSGILGGSDPADDAELMAESAFQELLQRQHLSGHLSPTLQPINVELPGPTLRKRIDWRESPEHFFMCLVSMGQLFPALYLNGDTSYHEVGHLFEQICAQSCRGLFGDRCRLLAPTGKGLERPLYSRMEILLKPFGREITEQLRTQPKRAMDGGLDVLVHDDIGDLRPGSAYVLVQCATGNDWKGKLATPNPQDWREWVNWRGPILRALAVPTSVLVDEILHDASRHGFWTLILDRHRLLYGLSKAGPLPPPQRNIVKQWCEDRVDEFEKAGLMV